MSWIQAVILVEFLIFAGFLIVFNILHKALGKQRLGAPPVHPALFATGKLAMGTSWGFLPVHLAVVPLNLFFVPEACAYVSACFLLAGIAFTFPAFLRLGEDSRFGLSDHKSALKMTGIYRISRNPMYLGFYLATLASLISVPHPLNLACGVAGIVIHHLVVLAEERFLLQKHGAAFTAYKQQVRRYL